MKLTPRLLALAGRPHLPRRTVRLRLTLLYSGLFLLCGAGLLAVTYVLFTHASSNVVAVKRSANGSTVTITGSSGSPGSSLTLRVPGSKARFGLSTPAGAAGAAGVEALEGTEAPAEAGRAAESAQSTGAAGPVLPTMVLGSGTRAQSNARRRIPKQLRAQARRLQRFAVEQHNGELHRLLVQSGIALALTTIASLALGWLVAGRVLSPLRTMTAATRRISQHNLHQRLSLQGPRDELKELADTIDGLLARLEAAFLAQRRFVANASHELRTPLTMMRTSLDVAMAKPQPVPPQTSALGEKLREGLDQAEKLLESFLTLARAEHGTLPGRSAVSLPQIAAAAIDAQREAIAQKGIEVGRDLGPAQVQGSPTLLSRMLGNLVDNAVRHNERGGWINVQTGVEGATARLVVESGGPLLDEDGVKRLTQPFARLGAERTGSDDGVGLGLSIVAAIAAAHGGSLTLKARPDGGLRVAIELPGAAILLGATGATATGGTT